MNSSASDYILHLIQTHSFRSLWIQDSSEHNPIKLLQSNLIPISNLIPTSTHSSHQIKQATLSSSSSTHPHHSLLSILIDDSQILQVRLPHFISQNTHPTLKAFHSIELPPSLTNTTTTSSSKTHQEIIKNITSSSSSLIFSSNSRSFQCQSNSNHLKEIEDNLAHHHATIQHLMISCDSNLIISSSPHHGVIVFDQLNQLHHKLNIKSKSKIVSISVSGFSSKLFTVNLESKILLFDLNLHSTKPITAFKFNQSNQSTHPSHQAQPSLINAHFSNINSNLIVFLNRLGQIGLADLTHHKVISQTQLRLSKNTFIKLSNFSPNGKTLICLTNDGQLISKDLKSSKQITLLKLSSIETRSTLQLLFQSNLTVDHHHSAVHSNQPIPRSHSNSNSKSQSHRTKQDLNANQTPTEILMTSSQPIELDRDSLHPSSSSSSISTLISPKLKPISTQPRSKKEFESGLKSEARVSTLVSKIDETLKDDDDDDPAERLVTVSVRQLRSIIEGCVNRSIEAHQRIMMEKFEELRLDVMRQGFSTRKEIDERFDQFGFRSNPP